VTRFGGLALAIVLLGPACVSGTGCSGSECAALQTRVVVFAASSLRPAFDRMPGPPTSNSNAGLAFNYAGSQTLTSQLVQGAKADVFASADMEHMAAVEKAGLVEGTPQVFAHNRLEIAVAKGNPKGIHGLQDLARKGVVVVLADPSVPAGKYAQQALVMAGIVVKPVSLELQVTGVLTKVALGEADAGIVYVSDVKTSGHVDGVPIPDEENVIADYPIAVLKSASDPILANEFVSFVLSANGQSILEQAGFEGA
jgi:molybdate transport system substrate-binding protein